MQKCQNSNIKIVSLTIKTQWVSDISHFICLLTAISFQVHPLLHETNSCIPRVGWKYFTMDIAKKNILEGKEIWKLSFENYISKITFFEASYSFRNKKNLQGRTLPVSHTRGPPSVHSSKSR